MCTHQRVIKNKYTGDTMLVKCGKCPACLQEKAFKVASRIKTEYTPSKIVLFVTLTYDNDCVPYVRLDDLKNRESHLNIYRDCKCRRVRRDGRYVFSPERQLGTYVLDTIVPSYDCFDSRLFLNSNKITSNEKSFYPRVVTNDSSKNRVGVCYFSDVQNFKKRLAINLKRQYGIKNEGVHSYKIFTCSEYGAKFQRPHFHLLIHISPSDEKVFRCAILESWPYADSSRTKEGIEIARNAANYVASYVSSNSSIHEFLSTNFKCRRSLSKDYGMANHLYSLPSILESIHRGSFKMLRRMGTGENEHFVAVSIPKYALNRAFPLFKGYSRLTDSEVYDVVSSRSGYGVFERSSISSLDISDTDLSKICTRLNNAYQRYYKVTGKNRFDYARDFVNAWKVFKMTNLRLWYEDSDTPVYEKYDNISNLFYKTSNDSYMIRNRSSYLPFLPNNVSLLDLNPNYFKSNQSITALYNRYYQSFDKRRKVLAEFNSSHANGVSQFMC